MLHSPDGAVLACSRPTELALGLTASQAAGRRALLSSLGAVEASGVPLVPDREPACEALHVLGPIGPRRLRISRPDGRPAWLRVMAAPVPGPPSSDRAMPTAIGALTVLQDVSELVMAEQRLRGEVPEDAFSLLAGSVAHDFNHLLTVIVGCTELIRASLPPDARIRGSADQVLRAARGATTLARELLDFSRRTRCAAGAVDLERTIMAMEPMLKRLMGPKIRLRFDLERPSSWVRANAAQLERVLLNLALNARDATREGGDLRIETRSVEIEESFVRSHPGAHAGSFVRLTVADNGAGMEPDVLEHLFEPFFTTKAPGRGSGLGLATVYGIVKQFGGYIEVASEPGRGTEFRIDLPASRPDLAAASRRAPLPGS